MNKLKLGKKTERRKNPALIKFKPISMASAFIGAPPSDINKDVSVSNGRQNAEVKTCNSLAW